MTWTKEVIEQIPDVYRDFMLVLRSVPDSKGSPVRITGVPKGGVYSVLKMKGYEYDLDEIARNLEQADLVKQDRFGFFRPTVKGEKLIHDLTGGAPRPSVPSAPPLPPL